MTSTAEAVLDRETAVRLASRSFAGEGPRHRVGLELEWHVYDPTDPGRRLTPREVDDVATAGGPLAPGVTVSVEPGGQVELDTPPLPLEAACRLAAGAAEELRRRLRAVGLEPVAIGADPHRRPENLLDVPRYRAMAASFSARGRDGVRMMANTAAFQVNVDLDPGGHRWRLAHQVGPVLVAAFANSPVGPDGDTGWLSHRLATWWAIDPTRTHPVPHQVDDPARAWLRYALDANVLLIRRDGDAEPVTAPFTFGQWLDEGHPLGPPTVDDFCYHLTTLFPPIRPRGYLELRFLDALEHPHWLVATAIMAGLLEDDCARAALTTTASAADRWMDAARCGLADDDFAAMATEITDLALSGLARRGAGPEIIEAVDDWRGSDLADRRTPAAGVLSRWDATGSVVTSPAGRP